MHRFRIFSQFLFGNSGIRLWAVPLIMGRGTIAHQTLLVDSAVFTKMTRLTTFEASDITHSNYLGYPIFKKVIFTDSIYSRFILTNQSPL